MKDDAGVPMMWVDRFAPSTPLGKALYVKPGEDGHPHERDERGWCKTCMAPPGCSHARCKPRSVREG
jgi:hypothetical protein